jgi:hypothetical protein
MAVKDLVIKKWHGVYAVMDTSPAEYLGGPPSKDPSPKPQSEWLIEYGFETEQQARVYLQERQKGANIAQAFDTARGR